MARTMDFLNLVIFSIDGRPLDTLGSGSNFDWTETGQRIVDGDEFGIIVFDPVTLDFEFFTDPQVNNGLAWSPLGNAVAYEDADLGLMLMSYPAGTVAQVPCVDPDGSGCHGGNPSWSPDGSWVAFEDGLEILRVLGSGGTAEVVVGFGDPAYPAYSPDGRAITFSVQSVGDIQHLWVTDARGTSHGVAEITTGGFRDLWPSWSPDGKEIYFQSNRSGVYQIWKVPYDPSVAAIPTSWGSLTIRPRTRVERTGAGLMRIRIGSSIGEDRFDARGRPTSSGEFRAPPQSPDPDPIRADGSARGSPRSSEGCVAVLPGARDGVTAGRDRRSQCRGRLPRELRAARSRPAPRRDRQGRSDGRRVPARRSQAEAAPVLAMEGVATREARFGSAATLCADSTADLEAPSPGALPDLAGARWLRRASRDLFLAQRFARHLSPLTTTVYTHVSDEELFERVRGLAC